MKSGLGIGWVVDESKCLSLDEVGRFRRVCVLMRDHGLCKKRFSLVRSWFMVELGLNAGLRVDEMAALRCVDLLIGDGRSSIVVVNGKGGKRRVVWISSHFRSVCHEFLDYKRRFGYGTGMDDFVLNNRWGSRISKRALQKFFKLLADRTGLSGHYHMHCLRHTYATFLLVASNNNYRFVQEQLGHSSIRTTQVYAGIVESEGRKALERMYKL